MKYNVIENGDYVLGKRKDIINYLTERKIELKNINLGDCGYSLDMYNKEEKEIESILKELNDYYTVGLIKLYRDNFDEMKWEEINI